MESEKLTERFLDDAPRKDPWKEDALGYQSFAHRLADALGRIEAPNGYVIGLHGAWGSGKSTALNFTEAFINKSQKNAVENDKIKVIRFEPWLISGHQDLVAAFFKQLSENIADSVNKKLRRRNFFLRIFKVGLDPAVDAAATIGATIDPSGGLASRGIAMVTKKGTAAAVDRWLAEPSLQKTYAILVNRLKKKRD